MAPRLPLAPAAVGAAQDRISEFDLKLMDIDSEHLGIPGGWLTGLTLSAHPQLEAGDGDRVLGAGSKLGRQPGIQVGLNVTWHPSLSHGPLAADNEYDATIKMPSAEFQRIMKDLSTIGDTGAQALQLP